MNRTNLVLGIALCTSLVFNIFSEEIKALINIVSLSIFAAVVSTVVLVVNEGVEKIWAKICSTIQNVKYRIKSLVSWTFRVYNMIMFFKETWDRSLQFTAEALKTIRKLEQEVGAKVKKFVVYLAIEAEGMIRAGGTFLIDKFRAFVKWVKSTFQKKNESPNDPPPEEWRKRVLLIVSLPYGKSYQAIKEAIGKKCPSLAFIEMYGELYQAIGEAVGEKNPSRAFIDWESDEVKSIPSILELPSSIRHFAVCLIPLDIWTDRTKSLVRKFQDGTYWELIGPEPVPGEGDCVGWTEEKIRNIDSIMEVGITTYSNDTMSQDVYGPLRAAWACYNTLWWNCFDFTVRLACLTLCEDHIRGQLKDVRERVEHLRSVEVIMRIVTEWKFCSGISGFFNYFFYIVFGTALMTATMAGLVVDALSLGLDVAKTKLEYMHLWRELSKELEKKFPQLEGLIDWQEEKK